LWSFDQFLHRVFLTQTPTCLKNPQSSVGNFNFNTTHNHYYHSSIYISTADTQLLSY